VRCVDLTTLAERECRFSRKAQAPRTLEFVQKGQSWSTEQLAMMIAISRVLLFVAQRVASTAPPAHVAAYSLRPALCKS
jgi:hypothetical protein